MLTEPAEKWPNAFTHLRDMAPAGMRFASRLLSPVLLLERNGYVIRARTAGIRTVRGERRVLPTSGNVRDWVIEGDTVWPLPPDTPDVARTMLDTVDPEALTLADVLALAAVSDPVLSVEIGDSVLAPADIPAAELPPDVDVPGLDAVPYPYQARGIRWMHETLARGGGIVLADEMGLGKTLQIIALLLLDPPSTARPSLIVCPGTLLANWERELGRFAPSLRLRIHHGPDRPGTVPGLLGQPLVLTTYDTLVLDRALFGDPVWNLVICDESQALRNPDTARRRAVAALARRACIPVTGTPVETGLLDLWSLVDLAIPALLGSREQFDARYPDDQDAAAELARVTGPVLLRRRVRDVARDLPERVDVDVPLDLTEELAQGYRRVRHEALAAYERGGPLVAAMRLALYCAHPSLVPAGGNGIRPANDDDATLTKGARELLTPRLLRTAELVHEAFANGRKVLVFAVFNRCAELLFDHVGRVPSLYTSVINGGTPPPKRQQIVDRFSGHAGPALLVLNPRAAGTGLNITAATVVIHFTPLWNPALESQASARAHRRGQEHPVTVYRLWYRDTVESVMVDRSDARRALSSDAVPFDAPDTDDARRALELEPGEHP